MRLKDALLDLKTDDGLGSCTAVVTDTSPFTVQINGDGVDIVSPPKNADYTPTLGDTVFVLRISAAFLVAFQIA